MSDEYQREVRSEAQSERQAYSHWLLPRALLIHSSLSQTDFCDWLDGKDAKRWITICSVN